MLRYVQMELAEGTLPDGKPLHREGAAARAPRAAGADRQGRTYGMGLMVDTHYGVPVVHHGGDMIGFHSDMIWLPEHGVGAVILTNGDPGWILRTSSAASCSRCCSTARRGRRQSPPRRRPSSTSSPPSASCSPCPPTPREGASSPRATRTRRSATIAVTREGAATVFDFGEWKSEIASRKNPDGTTSFVTIAPGLRRVRVRRRATSAR